jgi:iron complex outermembrane receptor protein
MRGLGGGYTQLLLDGERVPPGFSLETLSPEQIERIEILRAPTAETGARAIAGTINIITREGFTKKLNDLKLGLEHENGVTRPSLNWVRNFKLGERWNANFSHRRDGGPRQRQPRRDRTAQPGHRPGAAAPGADHLQPGAAPAHHAGHAAAMAG